MRQLSQPEQHHDGKLILRSQAEPELFGELFDRHYAAIYRFIQRRMGPELADELAAETFARAFDARERFEHEVDNAAPWLFGIATNLLRMQARTDGRKLRAFARSPPDPLDDFTG